MSKSIHPLGDCVLVQREAVVGKEGRLALPDSAKSRPLSGVVVAVGDGIYTDRGFLRTPSARVGDRIYFARDTFNEVQLDGNAYAVIRDSDILGAAR